MTLSYEPSPEARALQSAFKTVGAVFVVANAMLGGILVIVCHVTGGECGWPLAVVVAEVLLLQLILGGYYGWKMAPIEARRMRSDSAPQDDPDDS